MPHTKEASTSTFNMDPFCQATMIMLIQHPSYSILHTYNTLLATLSNQKGSEVNRKKAHDEFAMLYEANYSNLQRLQELQNQNRDSILTFSKLYSEKNTCQPRKNSMLSNIEWHFNDKNKKAPISHFISMRSVNYGLRDLGGF